LLESGSDPAIPTDVLVELLRPEVDVALGCIREPAVGVTVPEATVHDNDGAISWKDDIRTTGEPGDVKSEAAAHAVQNGPDLALGRSIPPADSRHVPTSAFWRQSVGHLDLMCVPGGAV
jgi:hypothetical protein